MSSQPGPSGSSEERTVSYQPEERYWTDYLRIALPVIGLLLLVGLLWYWASALIGDGSTQPPTTPELAAVITPINEATPAPPTATAIIIAPTPGPPATPTPTPAPPPVQPTAAVAPTTAPAAAGEDNPCGTLPVYNAGDHERTTSELNLREGPSTDSARINTLPAGTELEVTGEFQEAGQCDWWPVRVVASGEEGYVIEQYLEPAAS
jgi:hypothetical protein